MGQARVEEVDYYDLVSQIRKARDSKCLIERVDKEKWQAYLGEHGVRETSLLAFGKVKFAAGSPKLVAIVDGSDWAGCYAFSHDDEAALKFIPAS